MLGAIFVGLSGMNAYSKGLQTISNNVANLNTNGYKATSVSFSDLYSLSGGGLTYIAGARQGAGDGVRLGDPMLDFTAGELRQTQNDLDLAVNGEGFLVVLKDGVTYYTRTGQFAVDKDGYIADQQSGNRLAVLDSSNRPISVNVDDKRTSAPKATTKIAFSNNLSSSATTASVSNIAVYDSRGGKHVWTVTFDKSTTVSDQWTVTVKDDTGATVGTDTLKFVGSAVDPSTQKLTFSATPAGADPLSVVLDFSSGVTSFSGGTTSTIQTSSVDGYGVGALTTVTIDDTGQVKLTYSNNQTSLQGYVAVADFRAPQDLQAVGSGLYKYSSDNGLRLRASGVDGVGTIASKQIEASNVNLSSEFGDLILIQRGYQACSQVLSVTNDMIQQLFAIRGQG